MKIPAISVVIPVWNSGRYFRECLDNVLGQTLRNIEVLIVDDGSSDGSSAVADEYAARDARVTVIHQEESTGAGPARNAAMNIARGEYIAFMDSDDLYPSSYVLETLYRVAVEQKADICGGSLYKIDAEGNILDKRVPNQFFSVAGWYYYRDYQYDGGFYRFLYYRKFLKERKLDFPDYRRFQDAVFFVKTMAAAERFYIIPIFSYAYRKKHKIVIWTREKIRDHLKGIKEILYFSLIHRLDSLHYLMAKNFLDMIHYNMKFYYKLYFIYDVIKILNNIDWNIVRCENYNNKVNISFFKIIYRYIF
ncbi:MAG: glycosyltransferase family 2 protein [Bilophila wadsworthia]